MSNLHGTWNQSEGLRRGGQALTAVELTSPSPGVSLSSVIQKPEATLGMCEGYYI